MKIAVILPRNMHFGPGQATAIDLCAHDFVCHSAFKNSTTVIGRAIEQPYTDVNFIGIETDKKQVPVSEIIKILKADRPDVIVVHQHIPTARALKRQFKNIPFVVHLHNVPKIRSNFIKRFYDLRKYSAFEQIVTVSQFAQKNLAHHKAVFENKLNVVYNATNVEQWQPALQREKEILFVGRASVEKGVLEAAKAVVQALSGEGEQENWKTRFILSGLDGNHAYQQAIQTSLKALGARARVEYNQDYQQIKIANETAAIALIPSLCDESFGRTALEALAGGAVVMSSMRGGLKEVIREGGITINPQDHQAFTHALQQLMADEQKRQQLASQGRAHLLHDFDIIKQAQKLDTIYQKALGATLE